MDERDKEIYYWKRRAKELQLEVDSLKEELKKSKAPRCPVCATGAWCKVHETL